MRITHKKLACLEERVNAFGEAFSELSNTISACIQKYRATYWYKSNKEEYESE